MSISMAFQYYGYSFQWKKNRSWRHYYESCVSCVAAYIVVSLHTAGGVNVTSSVCVNDVICAAETYANSLLTTNHRSFEENMSSLLAIIVPDDDIAPVGARTFVGTDMTEIEPRIYTGPLFTKKMPSYGYRDPHHKPKTVWRLSQVYFGNPYTDKTASS